MSKQYRTVIVNNIKLPVNASTEEAFSVAEARLSKAKLSGTDLKYSVYRRSVDARKRNDISFVYSVAVRGVAATVSDDIMARHGMSWLSSDTPTPVIGNERMQARPVVVGSGPCGLFSALLLAENGYRPILIERGGSVEERHTAVERLKELRILDPDTNIQFGAGGAGTFSDGKLVTRINDPMTSYVLERFIEFGADSSIAYIAKPHIGTDVLSLIVQRMIDRIVSLGGEVMYHTKLTGIIRSDKRITGVHTSRGDIDAGAVILAIGHSARDTYEYLMTTDLAVEAKAFSVGLRIEHLAKDIDEAMYGDMAGDPRLGHAEYALSHNTKSRGVYTFCMCPGGVVVPAASEQGGVVVNGMSYSARNGTNSNSAVVCSVFREDYGYDPAAAISFQRRIERAAFEAAGGDYSAPLTTVGDFLERKCGSTPTRVLPTYMDGEGYRLSSVDSYLPEFISNGIRDAIPAFNKRIKGFSAPDAILTGAETRTSSPIRIIRDPELRVALGCENLYPAGEGAGYAGGITSASIDGVRSALALMKRFAPYHG